jgi:hypothetical protein
VPLSSDEAKRARQLANLPNLRGEATATTWAPGASAALVHGLRSRQPPSVVLDPLVREIEDALGADLPLQAQGGGVPGADRFAVELAAIALLRVRRVSAYLDLHGDTDARGNLRKELEGLGKAVEHAAKMLDRLGCSPRSRVALGIDVARGAQMLRGRDLSGLSDAELEELRRLAAAAAVEPEPTA